MRRIHKVNTRPELVVRRAAHRLGYRFRNHRANLPGTPDLVFPRLRKAILVHGCFWHQHPGCRLARVPKSRPEYWLPKDQHAAEVLAQRTLTTLYNERPAWLIEAHRLLDDAVASAYDWSADIGTDEALQRLLDLNLARSLTDIRCHASNEAI